MNPINLKSNDIMNQFFFGTSLSRNDADIMSLLDPFNDSTVCISIILNDEDLIQGVFDHHIAVQLHVSDIKTIISNILERRIHFTVSGYLRNIACSQFVEEISDLCLLFYQDSPDDSYEENYVFHLFDLDRNIYLSEKLILQPGQKFKQVMKIPKYGRIDTDPKQIKSLKHLTRMWSTNIKIIKLTDINNDASILYEGAFKQTQLDTITISDLQKIQFAKFVCFTFFYNKQLIDANDIVSKFDRMENEIIFQIKDNRIYSAIPDYNASSQLYHNLLTNTVQKYNVIWCSLLSNQIHSFLYGEKWPIQVVFNEKHISLYPYTTIREFISSIGQIPSPYWKQIPQTSRRRRYKAKPRFYVTIINNINNICYEPNEFMEHIGLFHHYIGKEFDRVDTICPKYQFIRRRRVYSGGMQQFIKTLTGKTIVMDTPNPSMSVEELKMKIFEKEGIDVKAQKLIFAGKELNDKRSLTDYNLQKDATMHLVTRLRYTG